MIEPTIEPLVNPDDAIVVYDPHDGWLKCESLVPYHGMLRNCLKDAEMSRGGRKVCATHGYASHVKFRPDTQETPS